MLMESLLETPALVATTFSTNAADADPVYADPVPTGTPLRLQLKVWSDPPVGEAAHKHSSFARIVVGPTIATDENGAEVT